MKTSVDKNLPNSPSTSDQVPLRHYRSQKTFIRDNTIYHHRRSNITNTIKLNQKSFPTHYSRNENPTSTPLLQNGGRRWCKDVALGLWEYVQLMQLWGMIFLFSQERILKKTHFLLNSCESCCVRVHKRYMHIDLNCWFGCMKNG